MAIDLTRHPCFSETCSRQYGRIHLPVAPRCNVQCNFCNRKYDCINESRPGVSSGVLSPGQAMGYLGEALKAAPNITVVGIAGPGDPFANRVETMETLRRVRRDYPEMLLCVASNGLDVEPNVDELAQLQVSHVTLTISAIDPAIAGDIYTWVRYNKRIYRGEGAGRVMIDRQIGALRKLIAAGIIVKVNTIVIPGVNDHHVLDVARFLKGEGVHRMNCMGMCHVPDTPFEAVIPPSDEEIRDLQNQTAEFLPQMTHCRRCRADAAGLLGEGISQQMQQTLSRYANGPVEPDQRRPYVAVASLEGMLINQHLGEAKELSIFAPAGDGFRLIERRRAPAPGGGEKRWTQLGAALGDCRALLCSSAGRTPIETLSATGLKVLMTEGLISQALTDIYADRAPAVSLCSKPCGSGCSGDGTGCM